MFRFWKAAFATAAVTFTAATSNADVKLHPLFCDNMVLQRDAKVPIWGTADPGEKVLITFSANAKGDNVAQVLTVEADAKGQWKGMIDTPGASTTVTFAVKGKNEIKLENVAVGDVWLCSGQSNMEWKVSGLKKDGQGDKVAAAAANKNIRLFVVPPYRAFPTPQSTFPVSKQHGLWLECTPETVKNFSAVGYFFAKDIEASQHVPIGMIESDWGGTPAEAWTSKAGLEAEPSLKHYLDMIINLNEAKVMEAYEKSLAAYKVAAEKAKAEGKPVPRAPTKPQNGGVHAHFPGALFNGMIAPLLPYKIKGAIWYQGESNGSRAKEYRTLYPAMIKDWRKNWGEDFPFFTVQLAPFQADGSAKVSYAELRDAQTNTCKVLPKVGMAVITDSGDETDIHPQRKEPVGKRLALSARAIAYGEKIEYSGPVYKSMKADGSQVILDFDHLGGGLEAKGETLHGFTVCGEDKVFHPAKGEIKGDKVVVSCDKVAKPVAVRFGWVNFAKPELNFFNKAGLPAVPFRTDDFPLTTK
ncbi:sialate O-acetylesterase [soil metagenome]